MRQKRFVYCNISALKPQRSKRFLDFLNRYLKSTKLVKHKRTKFSHFISRILSVAYHKHQEDEETKTT